jgi:carboxyvinyl-carboxyphosphonate phosphorylmutase
MNVTARRQRFRALLQGNECVYTGSVWDAISARIAEDLGYEVGMLGGSVASMAAIGAPDLMGLTLTEFAHQIYRITRAGDLSLLVDADDGYGNAVNVMRTVTELENAGVAGLTLEDTVLPPAFGANGETRLISLEEGVGRMKAALEARTDPDMMIIGRTSAAEVVDLDESIRRIRAYADAGVDAVFPIGVDTPEQLEAVSAAVNVPLITGAIAERDYMALRGVRVVVQSHAPFAAAVQAVYDTLSALRQGTSVAKLTGVANGELMKKVTRQANYNDWMEQFLT